MNQLRCIENVKSFCTSQVYPIWNPGSSPGKTGSRNRSFKTTSRRSCSRTWTEPRGYRAFGKSYPPGSNDPNRTSKTTSKRSYDTSNRITLKRAYKASKPNKFHHLAIPKKVFNLPLRFTLRVRYYTSFIAVHSKHIDSVKTTDNYSFVKTHYSLQTVNVG